MYRPNGRASQVGLASWFAEVQLRLGRRGWRRGRRLEVKPGGDRERQILWRVGAGSLSWKAQRVGGMSESSTSRRSYADEAFAVKSREIPDSVRSAKTPDESEKPTEYGDATVRRERTVGRTSGE